MVALDTAARAGAAPRSQVRRASSRWLLGTAAVLGLGAFAPLAVAPGVGHLSAAVMSLLLGSGAAAVGLVLGSARTAFLATLGLVLLLGLGRLPPRATPGYEEPLAVWQTDQMIEVSLLGTADAPQRLAVLAEPIFEAQQAPFGIAASVNGRRLAWQCPFQHGLQWLELPLEDDAPPALEVRLGLTGTPDRERNYLVVYHSANREGYLIGLKEDPSVPAPVTICTAV